MKLKLPKESRLLEWLLSEEWVIADSRTHVAVDMVTIQRSFVAYFPDAPVPDSGDVKGLIYKMYDRRQQAEKVRGQDLVVEYTDVVEVIRAYSPKAVPDSGLKETLRQIKRDAEYLAKAHQEALKERSDHLALERMDEALRCFIAKSREK